MKKITCHFALLALPLILLCGCNSHVGAVSESAPVPGAASDPKSDMDATMNAAAPFAVSAGRIRAGLAAAPKNESSSNRFEAQVDRKMVFTATLNMSVDDIAKSRSAAEQAAKNVGGYVQQSTDNSCILRIPVNAVDEVMRKIESSGTVKSRRITGTDVTESYFDIETRLANLKSMRIKLLALLDKSTKVDDSLKIEKELNRVVTDIERYEGQMKRLTNRISYVTLNVHFNASKSAQNVPKFPVPWVASLGAAETLPIPNTESNLPFAFCRPEGFASIVSYNYESEQVYYAASADDCVLKLTRRPSQKGAALEFWRILARRALTEGNNYNIGSESASGNTVYFEGARGGNGYFLALAVKTNRFCFIPTGEDIFTVELRGPEKAFAKHLEAVKKASAEL